MASNANLDRTSGATAKPLLLPEIGPDGIARESPVIAYTEKIIEAEQLQLRKYIEENYSKIRDVERELSNLSMEMKLTAGPKKAALEHMRRKIELATERIQAAKLKEEQARKAWEVATKAVKDEEAIKQKLCEDLNNLVQESNNIQFARLEELKRRLEALNPSRASTSIPYDQNPAGTPQISVTQDSSVVPNSLQSSSESSANTPKEGSSGNVTSTNSHNQQQPSNDNDGRAKRKTIVHGRGRGIGAVPKSKNSAVPGWTGAGFE
nr:RAB6-interacting golgin [Ipomoea batatas]